MTDLGEISYILGIQVIRNRSKRLIHLHQSKYASNILERFNMTNAKPSTTPSDTSVKLQKPQGPNKCLEVPYRQCIGSLMYLMLATRPDIASSLNKAAQFTTSFDISHWTAVKKILRYINGTKNFGLTLGGESNNKNKEINLTAYCDADWAGDVDDRRSTTGYLFFLNNHLISWATHKQTSVATSSTQAEYQALSSASKEAVWLRNLLSELKTQQEQATVIHQDNQSTMALASNPVQHRRTKHIDIIHHYVRELIEKNIVKLEYCPTANMTADVMTKALNKPKFEEHRASMGIEHFTI